jgi:hypothetical protein
LAGQGGRFSSLAVRQGRLPAPHPTTAVRQGPAVWPRPHGKDFTGPGSAPLNHLQFSFALGRPLLCGDWDSPALRTLVGRSGQERRAHSSVLSVYWIRWHLIYRSPPTTEKSAHPTCPTKSGAPICSWKTPVSTPLHLPLSTRLGEISLRVAPSCAHRGRCWPICPPLVPPEAPCSPAPSPKFSKRCPCGARLRPRHGRGARHSPLSRRPPPLGRRLSSRALSSRRRVPGGDSAPRPALLLVGGEQPPRKSEQYIPPGKLERRVARLSSRSLRSHFR